MQLHLGWQRPACLFSFAQAVRKTAKKKIANREFFIETSLGQKVDERMARVLFHTVLLIPYARKEPHWPPLPILSQESARGDLKSRNIAQDPSAALIRQCI